MAPKGTHNRQMVAAVAAAAAAEFVEVEIVHPQVLQQEPHEGVCVRVVGIAGPSGCGKSTMAPGLSTALNGMNLAVIGQDSYFLFDQYMTDNCPRKTVRALHLKNWDTREAINFPAFAQKIRDEKAAALETARAENRTVFLVVEGFQLCAHEETRDLLDVIVELRLPFDVALQRRESRALSMIHLPVGLGDGMNYEVPDTYVFGAKGSEARAQALVSLQDAAMASETCAPAGDLAWLRLYFEEVVWPEAERSLEDNQCGKPIFSIDASIPHGKEEWLAAWLPQAAAFIREALHEMPPVVA